MLHCLLTNEMWSWEVWLQFPWKEECSPTERFILPEGVWKRAWRVLGSLNEAWKNLESMCYGMQFQVLPSFFHLRINKSSCLLARKESALRFNEMFHFFLVLIFGRWKNRKIDRYYEDFFWCFLILVWFFFKPPEKSVFICRYSWRMKSCFAFYRHNFKR